MKEGTKSILFAEHNIIHSIYVIIAWKKLYKKWPAVWQMICILLHDIGYFGTSFLSEKQIEGHEMLGAKIAEKLFGRKGYDLVHGHRASNRPCSYLEAPDDYSWCLAPLWWLHLSWLIQKKKTTPAREWKLLMCRRWIQRFNGKQATSLWDSTTDRRKA